VGLECFDFRWLARVVMLAQFRTRFTSCFGSACAPAGDRSSIAARSPPAWLVCALRSVGQHRAHVGPRPSVTPFTLASRESHHLVCADRCCAVDIQWCRGHHVLENCLVDGEKVNRARASCAFHTETMPITPAVCAIASIIHHARILPEAQGNAEKRRSVKVDVLTPMPLVIGRDIDNPGQSAALG